MLLMWGVTVHHPIVIVCQHTRGVVALKPRERTMGLLLPALLSHYSTVQYYSAQVNMQQSQIPHRVEAKTEASKAHEDREGANDEAQHNGQAAPHG